jgi:hypothetical protein
MFGDSDKIGTHHPGHSLISVFTQNHGYQGWTMLTTSELSGVICVRYLPVSSGLGCS